MPDFEDEFTSEEVLSDLRMGGAFLTHGEMQRAVRAVNEETRPQWPTKESRWARTQMDALYGRNRDGPWPPTGDAAKRLIPNLPGLPLGFRGGPDTLAAPAPARPAQPRSIEVHAPPRAETIRASAPLSLPAPVAEAARRAATPTEPSEQELFRREFRRTHPGSNDGDADVAWGAKLRCSTIEID
jgi:hypothetical protein